MDTATPRTQDTYEAQWWRALAVFRLVSLLYAAAVYLRFQEDYERPVGGWLVLAAMALWTAVMTVAQRDRRYRRWPWLGADLAAAAAAVVVTRPLQGPELADQGAQTLPVTWVVVPVIAVAVVYGWFAAVPAAAVIGVANTLERGAVTAALLHNTVLVLLAGVMVGYVTGRARQAEERLAQAVARETAARERDRLARAVHDGVLQVLALVARRGGEGDGADARMGRLAAEQEVALRALVSAAGPAAPPDDADAPDVDLRELFTDAATGGVSVAAPPTAVLLPAGPARELRDAAAAALHNVAEHAGPGARAFVLLEDLDDAVVVTIRDDGAGLLDGRLAAARGEGRLGVSQSVVGRLAALGGSATYRSEPGEGVEVVLHLPRSRAGVDGRAGSVDVGSGGPRG